MKEEKRLLELELKRRELEHQRELELLEAANRLQQENFSKRIHEITYNMNMEQQRPFIEEQQFFLQAQQRQNTYVNISIHFILTHVMPLTSFYAPWKHQKVWFSDVFRGYRKKPATWNGLIQNTLNEIAFLAVWSGCGGFLKANFTAKKVYLKNFLKCS